MLVSDVGRVFDEWFRNGTNRNRFNHEGSYQRKFPVFRANGEQFQFTDECTQEKSRRVNNSSSSKPFSIHR